MISAASLMSLAPVGRRVATGAVSAFMRGGPGMGVLGGTDGGLGNMGILPLAVAAVGAAGNAAGSYFAADAQKAGFSAQVDIAEQQAIALAAPARYEYKAIKAQQPAVMYATAMDALTGQSVWRPKDSPNTWIYVGLGVVVLAGVLVVMKGV